MTLLRVETPGGYLAYWTDVTPEFEARAKRRKHTLLWHCDRTHYQGIALTITLDEIRLQVESLTRFGQNNYILVVGTGCDQLEGPQITDISAILRVYAELISRLLEKNQSEEESDLVINYNNR
ncbi:hypothetical protein HGA91_02590 [candidate division WWE3 bacterium]|nr:hypothetical protein [candidate division WWE3 bacterium]